MRKMWIQTECCYQWGFLDHFVKTVYCRDSLNWWIWDKQEGAAWSRCFSGRLLSQPHLSAFFCFADNFAAGILEIIPDFTHWDWWSENVLSWSVALRGVSRVAGDSPTYLFFFFLQISSARWLSGLYITNFGVGGKQFSDRNSCDLWMCHADT